MSSRSRLRQGLAPERPCTCTGIGLPEVLVTLLLVALLAALAHPGFRELHADASTRSAADALHGGLYFARSHALLEGWPTVLCLSADGEGCAGSAAVAQGWIVFVNHRTESPPQRTPDEALLRSVRLPGDVRLFASRQAVTYWPVSRAGTTATFTVCAAGTRTAARAVIVSQIGRPRTRVESSRPPGCET